MADKNTTQQFRIDVRQATRAVTQLQKSIQSYNQTIKDSRKVHKDFTSETRRNIKELNSLRTAVRQQTAAQRQLTAATQANKTAMQQNARAVNTHTNAIVRSRANINAMNRELLGTANAAAVFKTNLASAGREAGRLNTLLRQDRIAVQNISGVLNDFGRELSIITSRMSKKNRVIEDQTKLSNADAKSTRGLVVNLTSLSRLLVAFAAYRGFYALSAQIRESIKTAKDFDRQITLIQTITQDAQLSTARWSQDLMALNNTFGEDVIEVAAGAYEAISNQIVNAGEASSFLREELGLAITTAAKLEHAVNTTSTVLNAFKLSQVEAGRVNAVLFKTVDLGRVKLEELGSGFGKVSVFSSQLGVSLEEQSAALTVLTRQGLEADTALTLILNVMDSLIKPSKEMKGFFSEIGVESGQAAVQAYGFAGVLRLIAERAAESGNELGEIGELFRDLRAVVGAQGLVGAFKDFERDLVELKNAQQEYRKSVEISLDSISRRAEVQVNKLKQLIVVEFGQPILEFFVTVSEKYGGLDVVASSLYKTVRAGIAVFIAYKAVTVATTIATNAFSTAIVVGKSRLYLYDVQLGKVTKSYKLATIAQGTFTAGLSLAIGAMIEMALRAEAMDDEIRDSATTLKTELGEKAAESFNKLSDSLDKSFTAFTDQIDENMQAIFLWSAAIRAQNNQLAENYDKNFKAIAKSIDKVSDEAFDKLRDNIRENQRELDKLKDKIADSGKKRQDLALENRFNIFDTAVERIKDPLEQVRRIELEKQSIQAEGLQARQRGEEDLADALFERVKDLHEQQIEILKKERQEAEKLKETVIKPVIGLNSRGRPVARLKRVKEEAPDVATVERINGALVRLEEERKNFALERINAEEEFAKRQEERLTKDKEKLEAQQKAFEKLQEIFAQLESFDPKTQSVQEFQGLLGQAKAGADAAGLDAKAQFELFRQFKAQELQLRKRVAVDAARAELDIADKGLRAVNKQVQDAVQGQKEAIKTQAQTINEFATNSTAEIDAFLQSIKDIKIAAAPGLFGTAKFESIRDFEKQRNDLIEQTKVLKGEISVLQQQGARGGDTDPRIINSINARIEKIKELIKVLNDIKKAAGNTVFLNGATGGFMGEAFGSGTQDDTGNFFGLNAQGKKADPRKLLEQQQAALQKVVEANAKLQNANQQLGDSVRLLQEVQEAASRVPTEYQNIGTASEAAAAAQLSAEQAVRQILNGKLEQLEAVRKKQEEIIRQQKEISGGAPNSVPGLTPRFSMGGIVRRALGGFGADSQLAAVRPDEMVMNRFASRNFGGLLQALNHMRPGLQSGTTNTTNFGDIHIHPAAGTTPQQVREIAAELKRLSRRKLI